MGSRTGPRIAELAAQMRADIAGALAAPPPRDAVDWYLARAAEHARAGRSVLARAFGREARAMGSRRDDRHGVAEAEALLARFAPAGAPGSP